MRQCAFIMAMGFHKLKRCRQIKTECMAALSRGGAGGPYMVATPLVFPRNLQLLLSRPATLDSVTAMA